MVVLILAWFFNTYVTCGPASVLLSFVGLGCIALALFISASSSNQPQASLGLWFTSILSVSHGGGWILTQIYGEQHYSSHFELTDEMLAKAVALAGVGS